MENNCLLKIIVCGKLFASHYDRRAQKMQFKDCMKNLLVPVTSAIANSPPNLRTMMPGILPPTTLSIPLKTPTGLLSRTKGVGGGTAILCHPSLDQTFSCSHCDCASVQHHEHVYSWCGSAPSQSLFHEAK